MAISPMEIQKGSILCHEGKTKIVVAIGDYIQFSDAKAWIEGSMVEGEPLSVIWLDKLGFVWNSIDAIYTNGKMNIILKEEGFMYYGSDRMYHYVHELQMLHYIIVGEHLKVPKIKKYEY